MLDLQRQINIKNAFFFLIWEFGGGTTFLTQLQLSRILAIIRYKVFLFQVIILIHNHNIMSNYSHYYAHEDVVFFFIKPEI